MTDLERSGPRHLTALLRRVLRPIAALCLNRGLVLNDLIEGAKGAFLDAATDQLRRTKTKGNISRLSAMTGLHRADIKRLSSPSPTPPPTEGSIIRRVITTWSHSTRYAEAPERPRALSYGTPESQFSKLCTSISTSIPPPAILFELERTGRVQRVDDRIQLKRTVFQAGADETKGFELLTRDLETIIGGVLQNMTGAMETRNAHFSTQFTQIYARHLPTLRDWLVQQAGDFHRTVRSHLATLDRDLNPELGSPDEECVQVNISTGSFVREPKNKDA